MWTVVIISFITGVHLNGTGTSTAIEHIDFNSKETCEAAAKALTTHDKTIYRFTDSASESNYAAKYKIVATCLAK